MAANPKVNVRPASSVAVQWRKSSYSGDNGNCVELSAVSPGSIAIRDSKAPAHHVLIFSSAQLADLLIRVRADEV